MIDGWMDGWMRMSTVCTSITCCFLDLKSQRMNRSLCLFCRSLSLCLSLSRRLHTHTRFVATCYPYGPSVVRFDVLPPLRLTLSLSLQNSTTNDIYMLKVKDIYIYIYIYDTFVSNKLQTSSNNNKQQQPHPECHFCFFGRLPKKIITSPEIIFSGVATTQIDGNFTIYRFHTFSLGMGDCGVFGFVVAGSMHKKGNFVHSR